MNLIDDQVAKIGGFMDVGHDLLAVILHDLNALRETRS